MSNLRLVYYFFIANLLYLSYVQSFTEIPQEDQVMIDHTPYRVLGIGHACMDLLLPVSEEFLARITDEKGGWQSMNFENFSQIIASSSIPPYLATGGSCANTIKGLAGLGEKCAFFSRVGRDPLGEHFTQYMKNLGIVGFFSKSIHPTTQVLCLITPDGQRTMRFLPGCSGEMKGEHLHPDYFKDVKLVHMDSYNMHNGNLMEKAMELAKEAKAIISIDVSSLEIIQQFREPLIKLITQYVDIVFANENEIKAFTGLASVEGCFKLQEMCPIAVVLLGEKGCLIGHQGNVFHSPAFPANVVDSTGAGDLFASGFLYGYLLGYPLKQCAQMGNRMGGAIVEVLGAELPLEKLQIIRADF